MKRLEIKNDVSPNFIGNWDLENKELCKEIIDFFENNSDLHTKGTTGGGVDESIKKSTDITIKPENLKDEKYKVFNKYFENLYQCFTDYKEQYDFLKTFVKKFILVLSIFKNISQVVILDAFTLKEQIWHTFIEYLLG